MRLAVRDRSLDFRSVVIVTERVRLQAISRKFTEEIYRNFTAEIAQYMMPAPPAERADTAEFVESALLGLDRRDDLHLVICLHDGGEFLGSTRPASSSLRWWCFLRARRRPTIVCGGSPQR